MADYTRKTIQQTNKKNLKRISEQVAKRQQESAERFAKLSNGLCTAFSKNYDLAEITNTAKELLDGKIDAKKMGADWCIDYTAKCKMAIKDH